MSETTDHEHSPDSPEPTPEGALEHAAEHAPEHAQEQPPAHTPAGSGEQFDADPLAPAGANGAGNGAQAGGGLGASGSHDADLRRVSEVPLELSVEIGRTQMTVGETLDLRAGSIVTLDRLAGEPVDLLVNGTPIARGEVVVVDEQFGLRVTGLLEGEDVEQPEAQAVSEHEEAA